MRCLAAGFSFFTVDPGDHVDSSADSADPDALRAAVAALPWSDLEDTEKDLRGRYLGRTVVVEDLSLVLDEATLLRAAAKYGRAVAHVARMERHLRARPRATRRSSWRSRWTRPRPPPVPPSTTGWRGS